MRTPVDEQIVYNQLNGNERAVWSLLLAGGYLKVLSYDKYEEIPDRKIPEYELALTNLEVSLMFQHMISDWFTGAEAGIPRNRIRSYGFAFQGKEVLIG